MNSVPSVTYIAYTQWQIGAERMTPISRSPSYLRYWRVKDDATALLNELGVSTDDIDKDSWDKRAEARKVHFPQTPYR